MIAPELRPLRVPAVLLALALSCAACTKEAGHDARTPPPEMAAPAPPPVVKPAEDRGLAPAEAAPAPKAADGALTNVSDGEAERAASTRGHASAAEKPPPGSRQ